MSRIKRVILELRVPMYNGLGSSVSNPAVGIAHRKLVYNDRIIIRILKEDVNGNRLFPYDYEMDCKEALKYPTMLLKDGCTPVHVVPISRLTQILTKKPKSPLKKAKRPFKDIVNEAQIIAEAMDRRDEN
jgi:hypothetical protein